MTDVGTQRKTLMCREHAESATPDDTAEGGSFPCENARYTSSCIFLFIHQS